MATRQHTNPVDRLERLFWCAADNYPETTAIGILIAVAVAAVLI